MNLSTSRRRFISTLAASAAGVSLFPVSTLASSPASRLVILHTNDTHSRIDPFPDDGGRYANLGGVARRSALVTRIREENEHVLLLDSGDIFQGTPYFNMYGGELELRTMNQMGYDATTFGNHEFDNGMTGLAEVLPGINFPFISSNYDFSGAPEDVRSVVQQTGIWQFGGLRVGIFGLGIDFDRLVLPSLHEGVTYDDPIRIAAEMVGMLRASGCNYVICLSHLGYRYADGKVSDIEVAAATPGLDLILGGHTHTFMEQPDVILHENEAPTVIHQVGFGGIWLGRIDLRFDRSGAILSVNSTPYLMQSVA